MRRGGTSSTSYHRGTTFRLRTGGRISPSSCPAPHREVAVRHAMEGSREADALDAFGTRRTGGFFFVAVMSSMFEEDAEV